MYAHLPEELSSEEEAAFSDILRRRLQRRPTPYLTGVREFYGIEFYVAPGVLIPRPETELLVEESLRQLKRRASAARNPVFVDVGTGSGAIAISVARNWANASYFATDISGAALQIASLNARRPRLAGRVELLQGDLLQPIPVQPDVVAANLPYVPTADWCGLPLEIRDHEPREALDGGRDGLDLVRRLIASASGRLREGGALLLEVGVGQASATLALLADAFPTWRRYVVMDLAAIERVVVADGGPYGPPSTASLR